MPDPAATFGKTANPASNNRLSQLAGWGSPLFVIHKDITKTLESPNSINEIINGDETEAQYSVVLDVPNGARGFIPFLVLNTLMSASTAYPNEFKVTVTGTNTNPIRYFFYARSPIPSATNTYTPYSIGMTNAVNPGTYGYWHGLGAWRLNSSSTGVDNFVAYGDANNGSATPAGYSLPVADDLGTSRTYLANLLLGRASGQGFETFTNITNYPLLSSSLAQHAITPDVGIVPLYGCDKLTCFAAIGSAAPTIAVSANMGAGTLTSVSAGIAVRFVS